LQAPQLPRLQLRFVPVSPNFTAMTSHSVVRASYSAEYGLPLIVKVLVSFVIGVGIASGAATASCTPALTVVTATAPAPAAFRKFRREYFIFRPPRGARAAPQKPFYFQLIVGQILSKPRCRCPVFFSKGTRKGAWHGRESARVEVFASTLAGKGLRS